MDIHTYNAVAASTFMIWDYCITFDDEIKFIWRQKWSWVTVIFSIIRYVPIISSNVFIADAIAPPFPTSHYGCVALFVAYATWMTVLVICFETLLVVRVLALYGQHRLLRYVLIALVVCVDIARVTLLANAKYKYNVTNVDLSLAVSTCLGTAFLSIEPSALFVLEFLPEATFFLLSVVKLIHTKRTVNLAVSQLLVEVVCDGAWAFTLIFVFLLWIVLQSELSGHGGIAYIWVAPVIGFTGSRLIMNLRSQAESQLGGTDVRISEINFAPINASNTIHETV